MTRVFRGLPALAMLAVPVALGIAAGAAAQSRGVVSIRGVRVTVDVARTPREKARGLGGREGLAPDHGMLFVFTSAQRHDFWMLGMRFALDFVWIREGRIVDLTLDVPPPPADTTPESGLLREIRPAAPADHVLEVSAGTAARHGWKIGDAVEFVAGRGPD